MFKYYGWSTERWGTLRFFHSLSAKVRTHFIRSGDKENVILSEDEKQALLILRLRPSSILTKNEGALSRPIAKSLSYTLTIILTQLSILSNPSARM